MGKHLVCIHKGQWSGMQLISRDTTFGGGPKEGEIVKPLGDQVIGGQKYYTLEGYEFNEYTGNKAAYNQKWFRETDSSYGHWVEATVLESVILEEALAE